MQFPSQWRPSLQAATIASPVAESAPRGYDWTWFAVRGGCLLAGIVLLGIPMGEFQRYNMGIVSWATFLTTLLVCLGGFRIALRNSDNPWVEPSFLITAYYFVKFGFGALVIYYWDQYPWHSQYLAERFFMYGIRDHLGNACQIILVGAVGFGFGLSVSPGPIVKYLPRVMWEVDEERFRRNLWLFTPIPLGISTVLQFLVPVEAVGSVVLLGWVLTAMAIVATYWMFTSTGADRKQWIIYVIGIGVAMLAVGLITGMVSEFMKPAVMVAWGYMLARKQFPWKTVGIVVLVGFLTIFPWMTIYKYVSWNEMPLEQRLEVTKEMMHQLSFVESLELTVDRFLARGVGAPFPAIFSRFYPEVYPYEWGRTFLIELEGLVPRVLWEDKPQTSVELNKYSMIVGLVGEQSKTSAVFDAVTEYFINFGLPGVFFCCIIHGFYMNFLFEWLVRRSHYLMGAAVYLALFTLNNDFFGFMQLFVLFHIKNFPVWIFLFYLMSRRPKAAASQPA